MKIYELESEVEQFFWLYIPKKEDRRYKRKHFVGVSMKESWYPIEVEHLMDTEEDRSLIAGDFPHNGEAKAFSRRSLEALRDLLEPNGEILPMKSKDGKYYALNVLRIVDALDEEKSVAKRYDDGDIMEITKYVFHEEKLKGEIIFKIPQLRKRVFVTDEFIQRVRDEELLGFKFVEIYPHTPDPWAFLKNPNK